MQLQCRTLLMGHGIGLQLVPVEDTEGGHSNTELPSCGRRDGRPMQVHCLTLAMVQSKDAHDAAKLEGALRELPSCAGFVSYAHAGNRLCFGGACARGCICWAGGEQAEMSGRGISSCAGAGC